MVAGDKIAEFILSIAIAGLVSSVVFLFKWVNRLDLECHDLRRDFAYGKRDYEVLGKLLSDISKDVDKISRSLEKRERSVDRLFSSIERRISGRLVSGGDDDGGGEISE